MKNTTETLTKLDLQKIIAALTFWMAEIGSGSDNKKPIDVQQEYKRLFTKVVRMKNLLVLLILMSSCSTLSKVEEYCIKYPNIECNELLEDYYHNVTWEPINGNSVTVDSMNRVLNEYWKSIKHRNYDKCSM